MTILVMLASLTGCSDSERSEIVAATVPNAESTAPPAQPKTEPSPAEPVPALILTQARFEKVNGRTKPLPATLWLWRKGANQWHETVVTDPTSNVFHKGMWWRDGILTIGAMKAKLTHWKKTGTTWSPHVIWERSWGGRFDRLRDIEIGDVTGDGKEDLVLATHDQGVIAVGQEASPGTWTFFETPIEPDTFVHEIEIGDVDGDGKAEFYATPSDRNRSSGSSQPGSVVRYDFDGKTFKKTLVIEWAESHAKEILVANLDGDARDELYAVREAHVEVSKENGKTKKNRIEPVKIVQLANTKNGYEERVIMTLDDSQCRFLLSADLNHDGKVDLVAAGKESGLWLLERLADGTFKKSSIDPRSGGFEHAIHAADLDGDGNKELYVASDDQDELREYRYIDGVFLKTVLGKMPHSALTWNIQDGTF